MIDNKLITDQCAVFILPKIDFDKHFKRLEKYVCQEEQKYPRRFFSIVPTQTDEVSYTRTDKRLIDTIIESFPKDGFWQWNIVYVLIGYPPPGESILPGYEKGRVNPADLAV